MIDPNSLQIWKHKITDRARGTKVYKAGFGMPGYAQLSRRKFRTATEAVSYGLRVIIRWKRLYQAAVELQAAAAVPVSALAEA